MERRPEYLEDWWVVISTFEKVMWIIAGISAIIFMFQIFLFFNDFLKKKHQAYGEEKEIYYFNFLDSLLSFRAIVVLMTFFSWGTLTFYNEDYGYMLSLMFGGIVGILFFLGFGYVYYYFDNK